MVVGVERFNTNCRHHDEKEKLDMVRQQVDNERESVVYGTSCGCVYSNVESVNYFVFRE